MICFKEVPYLGQLWWKFTVIWWQFSSAINMTSPFYSLYINFLYYYYCYTDICAPLKLLKFTFHLPHNHDSLKLFNDFFSKTYTWLLHIKITYRTSIYKCIINTCEQIQVLLLNGWLSFCFHVKCVNSFQKALGCYFLKCCLYSLEDDEAADMFVFINSHRF